MLLAIGASAITAPFGAIAQQPGNVWRIGYFDLGTRASASGRYAAMMLGLREHGFIDGKNLRIESRFADGEADRLNPLAADLVSQKPDLILSTGTPTTQALQRATAAIPIVVTITADLVRDGFAVSLARPGGNITGMSSGANETVQKLAELLLQADRVIE